MNAPPTVKDYLLLEKIGAGSYSTVYRAFKRDDKRDIVAIKCVDKSGLSKSTQDNLITEINLLKILKHDHIVEMRDFFWDEKNIYIVMEYCNAGDLSSFIKKKRKLAENVCRKFLQQLALALIYLRENNVCHMDLKPQNLLLFKTGPVFILKIADFGFAQFLSSDDTKHSIRGSPLYMAPEILLLHKYDARVDLWSVGVIMYECLFGKAPYSSSTFTELAEKIKDMRPIQLPKGSHVSEECKDLLMRLLKHDPNERLTFEDFFAHEFLDLEHAPTKENFDKAVELVHKAVQADKKCCQREAYQLYCEALRYFIPILTNEADLAKKEALRLSVNEYIKRAEQLKDICMSAERRKDTIETSCTAKPAKVAEGAATSSAAKSNSLDKKVAINFQELCVLSRTTAGMTAALEIGDVAEQYLAEGNYELSLEKFKSSLKMLVPMLKKEPAGRRKDLLYKQMDKWMREAENTKAFLITQDMERNAQRASESHEQCSIQ